MPNWANTGMPAHHRAHRLGEVGRAVELDHVGAALLDQPDRGVDRARDPLLQRTEGKIAAQQRPLDAAAHPLADDQHLVEGHFERIGMSP